jgi:2-polyprenyl-6-methoxyphenol hydroxylase-like FAD-dependent oxidoreductase
VVIVGGGPVGLMLAWELGRQGVRVLVLERASEPDAMPKGNGLVGRIATVLRQRGLLRGEKGLHVIPVPRYQFGSLTLRLNPIRPHPLTILPIPQRRLEALLEARARTAGAEVRRGHAVTGFSDDGERVRIEVAADTRGYMVQAEFLVGCDGAHSTVRHQLGVGFPGTTSDRIARIGHVTIRPGALRVGKDFAELPDGRRLGLFRPNPTATGSFSLAPLSALDRGAPRDRYIVSTHEPRAGQEPAERITTEELTESIRRVLGTDLAVEDGSWLRSTVGNSRQAEQYRVGRVFLAGDAAHVFSAGGSSLNVGMLDAVDLAARLAAVVRGGAPLVSLDAYHSVRHEVGERAILQTRAQAALTGAGTDSGSGENTDALRQVLEAAFRTRNPTRYLATLLIGE